MTKFQIFFYPSPGLDGVENEKVGCKIISESIEISYWVDWRQERMVNGECRMVKKGNKKVREKVRK